jgi:hypothetical protein
MHSKSSVGWAYHHHYKQYKYRRHPFAYYDLRIKDNHGDTLEHTSGHDGADGLSVGGMPLGVSVVHHEGGTDL